MRILLPIRIAALLLATLLMLAPAAAGAQQADVIRGRVTGPDSLPVPGVAVTATSLSGAVTRQARTDRDGRFTIIFPGGEGDYMVSFALMGYAAKRFEVKRTADQEILVADTRLQRMTTVLDPVKIVAPRDVAARERGQPDIGGTEQAVNSAQLPASSLGDLAAMAASLPGVQLVPGENGAADGYSVLGLGADQNQTTLNGMNYGGSSLPRDAGVNTSLATAPYDVSRGGFSGGQFNVSGRPGSNFVVRGSSLNLDAPQLQWTDRAARALGQEYANTSLGGIASGPIVMDKAFYNVAWQLGRRASDYRNLLDTDPLGLRTAGVAPDSVARLVGILDGARVPLTAGDAGAHRLSDQGSLFGTFDFAPPSSTAGHAFNLTANGGWNRQSPAVGQPIDLPSYNGDRTSWRGGLQARHSGFLHRVLLSETSLGFNLAQTDGTPYLALPSGSVRVNSIIDGASSVQQIGFGGHPYVDIGQRNSSLAAINQLSWFALDNKHRLKLTSELRREGYAQDMATNLLGTFAFASLADLEAGRASSYTRQLAHRRRDGSQVIGALALGDAWRKSAALQFQYGLRVDGNRFITEPRLNTALDTVFGVRNDHAPNRVYLSPRAGFSWTYGSAAQIGAFEGAMRGPRAVVRGGIGIFQSTPQTQSIGMALDNTGLPGASSQVTCVGDATPMPDWASYAADPSTIPDRCADGSTGSVFANAAPNVTLFARDFAAPRALRSNLQWSGPVANNRFAATVDLTWSSNRNQQGAFDLNFAATPRFALADEDARPVYVSPTSISATSGQTAARESRLSSRWSRVAELRSDLRSESRQLSLRLSPVRFSTAFNWSASYTYANVRDQVRGFTSTAADPRAVSWGRSSFDSRHQVIYNLGYNFFDAVRVGWFGSFRSGTPFTPVVAGDINGDGYANDRAFVFDPAASADPALGEAMRALLADGSRAARDCLRRQLGRVAARNSCQGPWTSQATLSVGFNPAKLRLPQRASLSFQVTNPLGAADLLLHGSRDLRGWGQPATPDNALLYVKGFDPVAERFRYDVNQRFGATNPQRSTFRAPVTLTAMLRFDVGPTRERQMLTQQLDRGRRTPGTKTPEGLLRAMYGNAGLPNPMATILRQQDSLGLTPRQADSIATLNRVYTVRMDSIWSPVARQFGALDDRYDRGDAYARYMQARRASIDLLARLAPSVKGVLTAEQRRKLPPFVASHLEPRYLASIRNGTVSFTGTMVPGGGGPGGIMTSGGGPNITVIRQ